MTIVIGLTGSIGMGKSTVTAQFEHLGAATSNADSIVHQLLGKGGRAVADVAQAFNGVEKDGAIDRQALGKLVFADDAKLKKLESILHPLVVAEETRFVAAARAKGVDVVVMDIPLLFETGAELRCDATVVVTCPELIQRQRVLARPGMTEEKFRQILLHQMDNREKCARADFVVDTGLGKGHSMRCVREIMEIVREA